MFYTDETLPQVGEKILKRTGKGIDGMYILNKKNLSSIKIITGIKSKMAFTLTNEAITGIKKNYDDDVKAYDKVEVEILKMSDMPADGITKESPEKLDTKTMGMDK